MPSAFVTDSVNDSVPTPQVESLDPLYKERHENILAIVRLYGDHPRVKRTLRRYETPYKPLVYSDDSEALFEQEADRYRLLTKADERSLFTDIENGLLAFDAAGRDPATVQPDSPAGQDFLKLTAAYKIIFATNIRLVGSIAQMWATDHVSISALMSAGYEGLSNATTRFNVQKGYKFSTFATRWIRSSVRREKNKLSRTIHMGDVAQEDWSHIGRAASDLQEQMGRAPTDQEIAEYLRMDIKRVKLLQRSGAMQTVSLDQTLSDESDMPFHEVVGRPESEACVEILDRTERLLSRLSELQRQRVRLHFGLGDFPRVLQSKNLIGTALATLRIPEEDFTAKEHLLDSPWIGELTEEQRYIASMSDEGATGKEIGEKIGVSREAVVTRLRVIKEILVDPSTLPPEALEFTDSEKRMLDLLEAGPKESELQQVMGLSRKQVKVLKHRITVKRRWQERLRQAPGSNTLGNQQPES